MRRKIRLSVLCAMLGLVSGEAFGESSANEVLEGKQTNFVKTYVTGLGQGISWANAELEVRHGKQIYCAPPALGVTGDQYMAILEEQVRFDRASAGQPAGLVLLKGLKRTFPCR